MKRTRLDIIEDILSAILNNRGEIKPTRLMYKSNLSFNQMGTYMEYLIKKDFLRKIEKNKRIYISITEKGCHFANKLKDIKEFENAFGITEQT